MNCEDFPEREAIEAALQRVQSGELTPAEATQLLLAEESSAGPPATSQIVPKQMGEESLASLIDRLGVPPTDVVDAWCEQITSAAITYQESSGQALPAIDLQAWAINERGDLLWNGRSFARRDASQPHAHSLRIESQEQINRFRRSFLVDEISRDADETTAAQQSPADSIMPTGESEEREMSVATTPSAQSNSAANHHRASRPKRSRQFLLGGVALVCTIVIAAILVNSSGTKTEVADKAKDTAAPIARAADVDPAQSGPIESFDRTDDAAGGLETFEPSGVVDSASIDQTDALLSLDALIPASGFLSPPTDLKPSTGGAETQSASIESRAADRIKNDDDIDAAMDEPDTPTPDESPQQTRTSTVTAVPLPAVDDVATVTQLWDRPAKSLTLSFPMEMPLQLSGGDSTVGWSILDTRSDTVVARLAVDDAGTQLTWTDQAARSSLAGSLLHGRLTDENGSMTYLRPMIEADPWAIQLDQADVRPTWDLRWPIPPRVSRMAIEFDLPAEIEEAWIEPIEPTELRRTRGVAVLTPKDSETVALGIRFDVLCGRKVSVRVRFAARLAPTMPWQAISNASLNRFADQLTEQASIVSRQSTQMAAMYERADTNERRNLRPKRDQLEAQSEALLVASQRVAELQAMLDMIQASGLMKLRVWVTWNDTEQTLLATAAARDER